MSERARYTQIYAYGTATNDNAALSLTEARTEAGAGYLYIEKLSLSCYKAASGGGGICELRDTSGNTIFTWSVDGVQGFPSLDFGPYGYRVEKQYAGLDIVLSGANEQASVAVMLKAHTEPK